MDNCCGHSWNQYVPPGTLQHAYWERWLGGVEGAQAFVRLCHCCFQNCGQGNVSDQSIANGVDFARPESLRLIPPSLLERALLADVRLYGNVLKVVAPTVGAGGSGSSSNVVRGHFISFFQTGSEAAAAHLSKERVLSSFKVMFVGPDNEMDKLKTRAMQCSALRVDARNVLNWLIVRKALLPEHLGLCALEVPTLEALDRALGDITGTLVNEARQVSTENEVLAEELVGQDIAEVRTMEPCEDAPNMRAYPESSQTDAQLEDIWLDHRAVVPRHGAQGSVANTEAVTSVLQGIRSAVTDAPEAEGGPATGNAGGSAPVVRVIRSSEPVSEYEANDKLLYGLHWYEFLLGKGLPSKGSLTLDTRRHLQLQFSGRFARNQELNFLLSNQVQRHAYARSVTARVRNDPTSFMKFAEFVQDPDFLPSLDRAIALPQGEEAATILRTVQPFLASCSKDVPYSHVARAADVTKLLNLRRNFGLPSLFLTIAPDDVHNPLGIRMSLRAATNAGFPATDAGFAHALRTGAVEFSPDGPPAQYQEVIPITNADLRWYIGSNPVAAGLVYNRMMEAVWTCLLGITPVHMAWQGSKNSQPRGGRRKGLFGILSAAFGANEEQVRHTLHQHIIGFGGPPPEVLQSLFPDMVRLAADLLDSMFQAHAAPEVHIADMLRRKLRQPGQRHAYFESLDVDHDSFQLQAQVSAVDLQHHEHAPTCR